MSIALPVAPRLAPIDTHALKAAVVQLMHDFSLELTPGEMATMAALPADLPAGSRVYVTWIPGSDFTRTVASCARLREAGMVPVPHLAARAIDGPAALARMLGELQRIAGVDHALLIAGSAARPAGAFASVATMLATGLFEQHGFGKLGVAGHPEGAPDIAAPALVDALHHKRDHALRSGTPMHAVTQFCFAPEPIVAWERELRRAGLGLPVHVGLPGLASLPKLVRYARHCGVGASAAALMRRGASVLKLMTAVAPADTVLGLARARLADPSCGIERCHFFPFGGFAATTTWAVALGAGAFRVVDEGRDLRID